MILTESFLSFLGSGAGADRLGRADFRGRAPMEEAPWLIFAVFLRDAVLFQLHRRRHA